MDPVDATSLSEDILSNSKIEIPTSCEQTITLTKMEIVDAQQDVHMDNVNSQHLVETQYINIHRVSDLTKNLTEDGIPAELLSHHVVDLGSNSEYSQHVVTNAQFYENADFLSQSFSDDERRLELVAVQFMQQNRPASPCSENSLNTDLLNGKTTLPSVSSISSDKTVMSAIVSNYVQTVAPTVNRSPADVGLHIEGHPQANEQRIIKTSGQSGDQIMKIYPPLFQQEKLQMLPPLKKIGQSLSGRNAKFVSNENNGTAQTIIVNSNHLNMQQSSPHQMSESLDDRFKSEDCESAELNVISDANGSVTAQEYETDGEIESRSSQKSLPHKKRIPSKLKKALTVAPTRSIHSKCYKCTKCSQQFPTQATFNVHKLEHSSKKMAFACALCDQSYSDQLEFFEHLKSHYEPIANSNNLNDDEMSSQGGEAVQKFEEELEETHSPVMDMQSSPVDQQMNENSDDVYSNEQPSSLTCGKCGRVFRRQKAFDCHMSISHPKQEEIEEFSEPEDMMEGIRHVVNMVPTGDEEDKNFDSWSTSTKDIDDMPVEQQVVQNNSSTCTVSSGPPTPTKVAQVKKEEPDTADDDLPVTKPRKEMSCPHCERTFVHRNSLLYHIRSHTGHRPHQCELCGKSFFAAGALKIHHRLHSGDKPYKCEYCGRFFRQWGDLKYHFTSLHSNTKMFQCEYCGKDFARKYSLVVHRRIHTGEKNYICEYCTKTFRAASYLQNHRRIHTGEKPHTCTVCGKPFRVRSDMKRHMKTHPDVGVTNVLGDVSNNTSENNSTEVREMCIVNNQEMSVAKQEDLSNTATADQDVEQNIKPVISEAGTPLNLNVRPQTPQEGMYNYQREDLDRENTGTLYVWIQTNTDSILPDA